MLILKKESREVFKKPFGKLYSALDDIDKSYLENHFIISIGDATTKNLLDAEIIPKISIIDNKIERKASNHDIKYDAITLNADNPSGTITDSLQATIKEALDHTLKSNVLIVVNGEEDLAVIPCVLMAPKSSIILYGQPGEGIVVVKVDKLKETAKKMLDNFKVEEVK